jgi:hypothetical protein
MAVSVPSVEVADEEGSQGKRRPFAVGDSVVAGDVEPVLFVTSRELFQTTFSLVDLLDPILCFGESGLERGGIWFEPWVELDNAWREKKWSVKVASVQ